MNASTDWVKLRNFRLWIPKVNSGNSKLTKQNGRTKLLFLPCVVPIYENAVRFDKHTSYDPRIDARNVIKCKVAICSCVIGGHSSFLKDVCVSR